MRVFCSVLHSFFIAAQPRFASSRSLLVPPFCLFTFKLSLASLAVLSQFIFSSALTLSLNARSVALSHALSLTLSLALALSLLSALSDCAALLQPLPFSAAAAAAAASASGMRENERQLQMLATASLQLPVRACLCVCVRRRDVVCRYGLVSFYTLPAANGEGRV